MSHTPGFDPGRAIRWLATDATGSDGTVWSWRSNDGRGFPYPEAAALMLRLLVHELRDDRTELSRRIEARLWLDIEQGTVGKSGRSYVFDLGVAYAALATASPGDVRLPALRADIVARLDAKAVVSPAAPPRWSSVFGPHLLKLAIPLSLPTRATPLEAPLPSGLDPTLARPDPNGRIATAPHAATYLHAHCYAAEGLLALAERGVDPHACRTWAAGAAAWLARVQRTDGALPAWHDGLAAAGPYPADVCAQAIRLWCLVDRAVFADPIARAKRYLDVLTHPCGALRYNAGSEDLNVWSTAFAVQAHAWSSGASASPLDIL